MAELREQGTTSAEQIAGGGIATRSAKTNDWVRQIMIGTQTLLLEELAFAGGEMFDRAITEMHLFDEFVSKIAAAHSVKSIQAMFEECGQHQLEFMRRDSDRVFKHARRAIETASKLASTLAESGRQLR